MTKYKVIGIMSGTSLDGLDMAYCEFLKEGENWNFKIIASTTIPYSASQKKSLADLLSVSGIELANADLKFGNYIGREVKTFCQKHSLTPDFIASHGHTVFHQPQKKLTLQIGCGSAISAICNLPVVSDFRTLDVMLGGQGAPLVPIGDKLLFSNIDYCINLGGFANISYDNNEGIRLAYDICPANIVLNFLANQKGSEYDRGGKMAGKGQVHKDLLHELNDLPYYSLPSPKSLGKEWLEEQFLPTLNKYSISVEDKLRTVIEHIATQITHCLPVVETKSVLITGGGAYNTFLIQRIKDLTQNELTIPEPEIVDFKEALVFGFLGVLRWRGEINCLSSVTGSSKDSCSGVISLS